MPAPRAAPDEKTPLAGGGPREPSGFFGACFSPPQEPSDSKRPGRIEALEGLRTLLILWVLVLHYPRKEKDDNDGGGHHGSTHSFYAVWRRLGSSDDGPDDSETLEIVKQNGTAAVTAFLLISGFVAQLGRPVPSPAACGERCVGFLRRILRLSATYYGAILAWVLVRWAADEPVGPPVSFVLSLFYLQSWVPVLAPAPEGIERGHNYIPMGINPPLCTRSESSARPSRCSWAERASL
jgi:peptidoglycan/LPS O-acetylase OafA/YrhL